MERAGIKSFTLCALSLHAFAGCASPLDELTGTAAQALAADATRASNGNACTAGMNNAAAEADCLTIANTWGQAGARSANGNNGGGKLVYTGIDSTNDPGLIATEKSFAEGFRTAGGKAQGGVYGAHGNPGWIQGMPDNAAAGGAGTILHETFGATDIPWLGLSVCFGGNTGADASAVALAGTPAVYKNNISAASFITTYQGIPSARIVACKNGVVAPDSDILWCKQRKHRPAGQALKLLGDGTLVEGDGTKRGSATTKDNADDATGDFTVELQAEGPDADNDGKPDYPSRKFKVRNLPKNRLERDRMTGQLPYPWNLDDRCDSCMDGICTAQDNYPSFQTMPMCLQPNPGPGPGPIATLGATSTASTSGSTGMCGLMDFTLNGRFLTTSIVIEQPDGSVVSVMSPFASEDGAYAHFQFTPTQVGTHYIRVTDTDGLVNNPKDPDFSMYESFEVLSGPITTTP
jgi:hypothetical protein